MDKLTERAKLKRLLLETYGTITAAAVAAQMSESHLNMILTGKADMPLRRLGTVSIGWGIDMGLLLPLLSENDLKFYEGFKMAFSKDFIEVLPTS